MTLQVDAICPVLTEQVVPEAEHEGGYLGEHTHTHSLSLSLSLTHTHTRTHTHTHTHTNTH